MKDKNKDDIIKTLVEVFDAKLTKLKLEDKIDTSEPKDWKKFVSNLGLIGVVKLLMQHCVVIHWNFPFIVLKLSSAQEPFLSDERKKEVQNILRKYYDRDDVKVLILLEVTGGAPNVSSSLEEKNKFMVKRLSDDLDKIDKLVKLFKDQIVSYKILHEKEDCFFDFTICCANLERAQADMNAAAGHFCKYAEFFKKDEKIT